jgi:hypothetical protein
VKKRGRYVEKKNRKGDGEGRHRDTTRRNLHLQIEEHRLMGRT